MPLDIVTPAISSSQAQQDRWQPRPSRAQQPRDSVGARLPDRPEAESADARTRPTGSGAAFLAQALAQADAVALQIQRPVAAVKAVSITQRYELAESRDPILRGNPILFRVSA
jgi:hypothetical protein